MGWTGYHLFKFEFFHLQLRLMEDNGDIEEYVYDMYDFAEAAITYMNEYMEMEEWFTYIHDVNDVWQHRVTIEKIIMDYEYKYPQVIKYKGGSPSKGYNLEYDMVSVNEELKNYFTVTLGKGEKRRQRELYEAMLLDERGFTASKTGKNVTEPISSYERQLENALLRFADMVNSLCPEPDESRLALLNHDEDTLEYIFDFFEKDELVEIAKFHDMKGYSKYSKDELSVKIAEYILRPEIMMRYFSCLRDNEIKEFERISKQKKPYAVGVSEQLDRIEEAGYAGYYGENRILIPRRVVEVYNQYNTKSFNKIRRERNFLLDCFSAAGSLYGVAPLSVIGEMYNQNIEASNGSDLLTPTLIIKEYENIPSGLLDFVIRDNRFIYYALLRNNGYKRLEQLQGNKSFYIPTASEIRELAVHGYFPNDKRLKQLKTFLITKLGISLEMAEYIGVRIQNMIRSTCELEHLLEMLNEEDIEFDEMKELNQFVDIVNEMSNHTRMILNRGFTPDELTKVESKNPTSGKAKVINFQEAKMNKRKR